MEVNTMEYIDYIFIGLIAYFIFKRFMPVKGVRNITTSDLKNDLTDQSKQFIDVRTAAEYKGNNIRQFKNIPLHQLSAKADKELAKDKEVVVICQSGMRSQKACKTLKKLGYEKVTNVRGGMSAWR
jgi:rhodanese-related sulfurtransferase